MTIYSIVLITLSVMYVMTLLVRRVLDSAALSRRLNVLAKYLDAALADSDDLQQSVSKDQFRSAR